MENIRYNRSIKNTIMATIKFKNAQGQWEEVNAAKLETPRNINGVPFDGTQDITIPTGASDYQGLSNKPQINGIELDGNKTSADLGIEPAKGADDFYVTGEEKAKLGNPIVDYTVPNDTTLISFITDKNGIKLGDVGLNSVLIVGIFNEGIAVVNKVILNDIETATYNNQNTSFNTAIPFTTGANFINFCSIYVTSIGIAYNTQSLSYTIGNPSAFGVNLNRGGVNSTITNISKITIGNSSTIIKAGSKIKIYRND